MPNFIILEVPAYKGKNTFKTGFKQIPIKPIKV